MSELLDVSQILTDVSAFTTDGIVDFTNPKHIKLLTEALMGLGYDEKFINEFSANVYDMAKQLSEKTPPIKKPKVKTKPRPKTSTQGETGSAREARQKNLDHIAFGYYGKNGKVMFKSSKDKTRLEPLSKEEKVKAQSAIDKEQGKLPTKTKTPSGQHPSQSAQPQKKSVYGPGQVVFNNVGKATNAVKRSLLALSQVKSWKSPKERDIVTKAMQATGDGDTTLLQKYANVVNQYVRVGGNLGDAKLYFAIKEPGNFSQGVGIRKKVEGIGKEYQETLMKAGMKVAATTTVGGKESAITSKMFAATGLFGEKNRAAIPLQKGENTLTVGTHTVSTLTEPSFGSLVESALIEIYRKRGSENPERDAQFAMRAVRKHNTLLKQLQEKLDDKSLFIDPLPGVTPDTEEGRKQIVNATISSISNKFKTLFASNMTPEIKDMLGGLDALKTSQNFEQDSLTVLTKLSNSDSTKRAAADIAELFTYARRLTNGQIAYLPAASNFPLADLIAMSPLTLTKDSSAEDIVSAIQSVFVSFDYRSIKKGEGGASATDNKVNLSVFKSKETRDRLNRLLSTTQTIWDFQKPEDAYKFAIDIANETGIDTKSILGDSSTNKTISTVVAREKDTPGLKPDLFKKQLVVHNLIGKMIEKLYNDDVDIQLFSNERYKESKRLMSLSITDGVKSISELEFILDIGKFSKTSQKPGKPETAFATRFHPKEL